MKNKPRVYFRADGNAQIGLGHVIRSLALADMLKNDFDCHFIIQTPLPSIKEQILTSCLGIIELDVEKELIIEAVKISESIEPGEIIVLDGYNFITAYQKVFKDKGIKVVCIDDIHAYHFVADAVINHAPNLQPSAYSIEAHTKLCLGLDYSLLRAPFLEVAVQDRSIIQIENAFICLGGSDFNNITIKILQDLKNNKLQLKKLHIVLGGANLYKEEVKQFASANIKSQVFFYENLSASEISDVMKKADIGIVPASSILYEATAVKMPVISGFYVNNQINVYEGFKALGLIFGVGDMNKFTGYSNLINSLNNEKITNVLKRQKLYNNGSSKFNLNTLFRSIS
jgi:UDP-2,4-diacetamido-2,4,6-trideoxy-beta-L-altropyranose hydrolase